VSYPSGRAQAAGRCCRTLTTVEGRRGSLRALRWVIVSLALVLAVVLIARGDIIIGALVGASAVLRVVFLLSTSRSRRRRGALDSGGYSGTRGDSAGRGQLGTRGPGNRANRGDANPVGRLLRELAPQAFEVAAGVLGVTATELRHGFEQGRPAAEVARATGVSVETVVAAVAGDASVAIDRAVNEGRVSPATAARAKARLPMWAARLIYGTRGQFQPTRGWR
jgi:hypothetical protein